MSYQAPQSAPAYQTPSGNYQAPPPGGYQQPAGGYRPPQGSYSAPPAAGGYPQAPAGYQQQPPANYQQPQPGGYAPPQTQGAAPGYQQPLNYQQQAAGYPQSAAPVQAQFASEEQIDSHHKHQDARHSHNHVYPDRGTVVHNLPAGSNVVNFGGQSYWFSEGVWFEPHGPAYTVIEPPIGVVVTALPSFATAVVGSAGLYFYANDTYYRPRPDLGGYEVVNDPVDSAPAGSGSGYAPVPAMAAPAYAGAAPAPAPGYAAPMAAGAMMAAPAAASMAAAPTGFAAPASASVGAAPGALVAPAAAGQFSAQKPQMVSLTPNNGQTTEQQARDRYDCYRTALSQSGFDPLHPKGGPPSAQVNEQASTYDRVRTACLQQRGYTVQ